MLVKCPNCGTLVSDKAAKCPKCGIQLINESPATCECAGIVKIINKVVEMKSKFPDFWAKVSVFPDNFSVEPLIDIIPDENTPENLDIHVDVENLKKLNLVSEFEGLSYHNEFVSSDSSICYNATYDKIKDLCQQGAKLEAIKEYKEVTGVGLKEAKDFVDEFEASNFRMLDSSLDSTAIISAKDVNSAAKIVHDIVTIVYKRKLSAIRLVITGVEDNADSARYNSDGEFLDGTGYGQGEFAYYKKNVQQTFQNTPTHVAGADEAVSGGYGKIIWWIIGIIAFLIYVFS